MAIRPCGRAAVALSMAGSESPARSGATSMHGALLRLQAEVGNRAVGELIGRGRRTGEVQQAGELRRAAEPPAAATSPGAESPGLQSPYWSGNARLQAAVRNAPPLSANERGEAVALLQGALAAQGQAMPGSTRPDGSLDGVWGDETTAAVRAFQADAGVRPIGGWEAGRRSLSALDARIPSPSPPPPPAPEASKTGVGFDDMPILAGPSARSTPLMAFAVSGATVQAPAATASGNGARIRFQDSVENSVYQVARWMSGNDDRKAAEAAHRLVFDPEATFTIDDGRTVDLKAFEADAGAKHEVVLKPEAVARLTWMLNKTPADLEQAIADDRNPQLRGLREKADDWQRYGAPGKPLDPAAEKSESRGAGQKRHELPKDTKVLESPQVARLYLDTLDRYARPTLAPDVTRKMAEDGLDAAEVGQILAGDPRRTEVTGYFVQGVGEYRAAGGTDLPGQFFLLETTLLDQFTWGNPTVIANQLKVGKGIPEQQVGLAHRPDGILFYDGSGTPLPGHGGVGVRDPGNRVVPKDSRMSWQFLNLDGISDPAIRGFFIKLKQEGVNPTLVLAAGIDAYAANYEDVNRLVMKGMYLELIDQAKDAVRVMAGFMIVRGASMVLKRQTNTFLKALGWAIDGAVTLYQYYLDIEMLGSLEALLMKAGECLVRVKPPDQPGNYDAASLAFMNQAAAIIRPILAQIIVMLVQHFLAGAKDAEARARARKKARLVLEQITGERRRTSVECNTCQIIWKAAEYSQEVGKDVYRAEAARRGGVKPGQVLRTPDGVDVHPDGNVFGLYQRVLEFFRTQGHTDRPSDEVSFESHHLLESHQMEVFGITENEGRCVGLERADHATFSAWMRGIFSRESQFDIHDIYALSAEMYRDNGHPEYIPEIRGFLRQHRERIRQAYQTGAMRGRPEAAQAMRFLSGL